MTINIFNHTKRPLSLFIFNCFASVLKFIDIIVMSLTPCPQTKNGILLIRLDAIGDFFLWLNSAVEYRKIYPNKKIVLIGNKYWASFAKKIQYWDAVWSVDVNRFYLNPLYRYKILSNIRRSGFEIAISTTHSRLILLDDSIIHASKAIKRICLERNEPDRSILRKRLSNILYTDIIDIQSQERNEFFRNAEIVRCVGQKNYKSKIMPLLFRNKLNKFTGILPSRYYILFPGAGSEFRKWPCENFAMLADKIFLETGYTGVVCGGGNEIETSKRVVALSNAKLIDLSGKTTLTEFWSIIRQSSFLISNETSAVHMAVSARTPSVCILGGGHYGRFLPYLTESDNLSGIKPISVIHKMPCFGCNWQTPCLSSNNKNCIVPCILKIKVSAVWNSVMLLISETSVQTPD